MFEQKKTKQDEQDLAYSSIESPEVGSHSAYGAQDIIDFVRTDTRSQSEIFKSLKQRIQDDYDGSLTEEEAIAATRRFIGFFQTISDIYDGKQEVNLDEGGKGS